MVLIVGMGEIATAVSVWLGGSFGHWVSILVASITMVAWLSWIPIMPFWALFVMFLDVLVIYGLAVYGGQRQEA